MLGDGARQRRAARRRRASACLARAHRRRRCADSARRTPRSGRRRGTRADRSISASSVSPSALAAAGSCSSSRAAAGSAAASRPSENAAGCCVDGDAVQLDRALHRREADRDQAALPGQAHRDDVGDDGVAEELLGQRAARPSSRRDPRRRRTRSLLEQRAGAQVGVGVGRATRRPAISCMLARTRVRPWRTVASASADAATTRSQASTASACCASMRTWFRPPRCRRGARTTAPSRPSARSP